MHEQIKITFLAINVGTGLFLGWITMVVLILVIIFFSLYYRTKILRAEKEKQLLSFKASIEAVEIEKEKIANNLHDEVIPLLTALSQNNRDYIKSQQATNLLNVDFKKDTEIINQSIIAMKAIALGLLPSTFANFGLLKALEQYCNFINSDNYTIEFKVAKDLKSDIKFSKLDQMNIYRICTELLNNLQKHAKFNCLQILVSKNINDLIFEFTHDGIAVSNDQIERYTQTSTGLGLKSLKTRTLILNATLDYSLNENHVPTIILRVPAN